MKGIVAELFRMTEWNTFACASCNQEWTRELVERYSRNSRMFLLDACCDGMELEYIELENALAPDSPEQSLAAVLTPRP